MLDFEVMATRPFNRKPKQAQTQTQTQLSFHHSKSESAVFSSQSPSRNAISTPTKVARHSSLRQHPHSHNQDYRNNNSGGHGSVSRNDLARKNNTVSHKQSRQGPRGGRQSNSNQRYSNNAAHSATGASSSSDEEQQQLQLKQASNGFNANGGSLPSTPTKKPHKAASRKVNKNAPKHSGKVVLLTRSASESEQQNMLEKFSTKQQNMAEKLSPSNASAATHATSAKRTRRRQASPQGPGEEVVPSGTSLSVPAKLSSAGGYMSSSVQRTPTRRGGSGQQAAHGTPGSTRPLAAGPSPPIFSPVPRHAGPTPQFNGSVPGSRGTSPSGVNKSNHYAGASFNNSPAPSTLPLPPAFLTTPAPASMGGSGGLPATTSAGALSQRTRQLEEMIIDGNVISPSGHYGLGANVIQPATDLTSMFQKLRLFKEMTQSRPASVPTTQN